MQCLGAIFPNSHERRPENLNPAQIVDSDRRSRLAINFVLFALNQQNSNDYVITNNVLEYSDGPNQVFQITKQGNLLHFLGSLFGSDSLVR